MGKNTAIIVALILLALTIALTLLFSHNSTAYDAIQVNSSDLRSPNIGIPYNISNISGENEILVNCRGLSLYDTSNCIYDNIQTAFKYKDEPNPKYDASCDQNSCYTNRPIDDIIQNGGVCYEWAIVYVKIANDLGFQGKHIELINTKSRGGHSIAFIYGSNGYCIIDQNAKPICLYF